MTKKEKNDILAEYAMLNDDDIEELYCDSVYSCLGFQVELMKQLGYDMRDILERENYVKFLWEKACLIGHVCESRGIELCGHVEEENE